CISSRVILCRQTSSCPVIQSLLPYLTLAPVVTRFAGGERRHDVIGKQTLGTWTTATGGGSPQAHCFLWENCLSRPIPLPRGVPVPLQGAGVTRAGGSSSNRPPRCTLTVRRSTRETREHVLLNDLACQVLRTCRAIAAETAANSPLIAS